VNFPALPRSESLAASSRLSAAAVRLSGVPAAEAALLAALGVASALLTTMVDLDLHLPGHSILRCVLPVALGLALVPRRFAGSVMGCAALATVLVQGVGGGPGWGAATSLVLTGPILDFAATRARSGRSVYAAFVAAGAAANLAAFGVRLGAKLVLHDGGRPVAAWWPEAIVTYALCGAFAGIVSAALWFRLGSKPNGGDAR
jgi:hypothetical protein